MLIFANRFGNKNFGNISNFIWTLATKYFLPFESPCIMLSAKSIHIYCSKENYSQSSLKHERYMCKVYEFNIPCTKGIIHSKALNFSLLRYYWTTTRRSKFLWENLKIRFFWWNPHSSIGGINFFLLTSNIEFFIWNIFFHDIISLSYYVDGIKRIRKINLLSIYIHGVLSSLYAYLFNRYVDEIISWGKYCVWNEVRVLWHCKFNLYKYGFTRICVRVCFLILYTYYTNF